MSQETALERLDDGSTLSLHVDEPTRVTDGTQLDATFGLVVPPADQEAMVFAVDVSWSAVDRQGEGAAPPPLQVPVPRRALLLTTAAAAAALVN